MPLHHAHEPYASPAGLIPTLQALGLGGVVMPGALAWDAYPRRATPTTVTPSATDETDGSAATLISAGVITVPYYVTYLAFRGNTDGDFQLRWKLQTTTPTVMRVLRSCNNRTTAPNGAMQSLCFPPIPIAAGLGVQAILATHPGSGPAQQAYVSALKQSSVIPVPEFMAVAPRSNGDAFPSSVFLNGAVATTSSQTAWAAGPYVEVTPGLPTPVLITAVWGQIQESITNTQASFATGASGGEVEWGTFGFPNPGGSDDADTRHNLMPFPLYLPANTRVALRARSQGTNALNFQGGLEYVPVPIR